MCIQYIYWANTIARWVEKHLRFGTRCHLYWRIGGMFSIGTLPIFRTPPYRFLRHRLVHKMMVNTGYGRTVITQISQLSCLKCITSPVVSPHKGQSRGDLMFSLILAWTNGWANNWDTADLRCHRAHHDVSVMVCEIAFKVCLKMRRVTRL